MVQLICDAQRGTDNLFKTVSKIEQKQDEKLRIIELRQAKQESRQYHGKKMMFLLRRKKFKVIWYTVQFILQNVYNNRFKSRDEMFRYILMKDKSEINLFDVRWLQKELSNNHFFKKLIEQESPEVYQRCLGLLLSGDGVGYKQAQPGDTIIKYMDIGKTFYVIFKGMVDVFCPAECTAYLGVLEYNKLLEDYRDMVLSIDGSDEIPEPNQQYKEMEAYQKLSIKDIVHILEGTAPLKLRKEKDERRPSIFERRNSQQEDEENSKMFLKLEQGAYKSVKEYRIRYLKKVARVGEGASFVELALLTTKPRSSTIKAVTKTDMVTINKDQFKRVFSKVNKKILKHNIEHTLTKQEVLFKEGSRFEKAFLLTAGEFEISKKIDVNSISTSILDIPENPDFRNNSKIVNCKISKIKANEIVGLEEILLDRTKYITTLTCVSKKGKVIEVTANELFSKNKNPSTLQTLEEIGKNKTKFLYDRISWYREYETGLKPYHEPRQTLPLKNPKDIQKIKTNLEQMNKQAFNDIIKSKNQIKISQKTKNSAKISIIPNKIMNPIQLNYDVTNTNFHLEKLLPVVQPKMNIDSLRFFLNKREDSKITLKKAKHKEAMENHNAFMKRLRSGLTSRHLTTSIGNTEEFIPFDEPEIDSTAAIMQEVQKRFNTMSQHKNKCQQIRQKISKHRSLKNLKHKVIRNPKAAACRNKELGYISTSRQIQSHRDLCLTARSKLGGGFNTRVSPRTKLPNYAIDATLQKKIKELDNFSLGISSEVETKLEKGRNADLDIGPLSDDKISEQDISNFFVCKKDSIEISDKTICFRGQNIFNSRRISSNKNTKVSSAQISFM
ncbi:unnamed protein product [Moneuplotes crassus]|uniref:Cyclic nucleotide-binding domain-containing protein n=1 Tax=Euplotes crassus TaxID=5936 RepID=A0AAD1XYS5_EUPCR|nr:unnamed protein product [Moneuplotes crassus]